MLISRLRSFFCTALLFSLFIGLGDIHAAAFNTVVIDPGHGGRDDGASRGDVKEKDLNLKVAKKLSILLKAEGFNVVMTRDTDKSLSLDDRAFIANKYKDSIFVSIHFNAAASGLEYVKGVETFYASGEGQKIANEVHKQMLQKMGVKDRKVKRGNYKVLEKTESAAILVECGFISNSYERKRCASSWYQSLCASSIAEGVKNYRKKK